MMPKDILVRSDTPLREVLARIDASGTQIALVVDENDRLVGTISDGDIRRGLLRGLTLNSPAIECANTAPRYVEAGTNDAKILQLLKKEKLRQMPVVDAAGKVVELKLLDNLIKSHERPNPVFLMVGGLGQRLGHLTKSTPKPMLPVGGRPLLETILTNFCAQGFQKFYLAINYKGEVIENHFGDGSNFGCEITYIREKQRMGTAGALSLLENVPSQPMIVSNGDLLLSIDYGGLVDHHVANQNVATMAVREYEHQIPYGVIRTEQGRITSIEEKPSVRCQISGGVYVLSPEVVRMVPPNTFYDMPTLFEDVIRSGQKASVYQIDGYWLDIGRISDYEKAQMEFEAIFKCD